MGESRKKILLIDDNDDTLDMLEIFLFKSYDIITAHNGFDGLNKAEKEIPHCIISDIMMPVMDGIKFFNNLKKRKEIAHIPVIAITSFIKKMSTRSLLNIGFSSVISKPFNRKDIIETVQTVLEPTNPNGK